MWQGRPRPCCLRRCKAEAALPHLWRRSRSARDGARPSRWWSQCLMVSGLMSHVRAPMPTSPVAGAGAAHRLFGAPRRFHVHPLDEGIHSILRKSPVGSDDIKRTKQCRRYDESIGGIAMDKRQNCGLQHRLFFNREHDDSIFVLHSSDEFLRRDGQFQFPCSPFESYLPCGNGRCIKYRRLLNSSQSTLRQSLRRDGNPDKRTCVEQQIVHSAHASQRASSSENKSSSLILAKRPGIFLIVRNLRGSGAIGTSTTRKEYERYSFGIGTFILLRTGRTIVSIGGIVFPSPFGGQDNASIPHSPPQRKRDFGKLKFCARVGM